MTAMFLQSLSDYSCIRLSPEKTTKITHSAVKAKASKTSILQPNPSQWQSQATLKQATAE